MWPTVYHYYETGANLGCIKGQKLSLVPKGQTQGHFGFIVRTDTESHRQTRMIAILTLLHAVGGVTVALYQHALISSALQLLRPRIYCPNCSYQIHVPKICHICYDAFRA